ncbi:hypothetical protein [Caloramator sp. Dgby_cultured_2]|nr:hypothetical protein [Caloramator sp. Dgby_cultured_2]WDU82622.1 hypothetical protein PWK10_13780 [Caloramator sp. Dgby_cultured_2]
MDFVRSNKGYEIYPLTRRLDTGELYKFIAIKGRMKRELSQQEYQ